MRYVFDRNIPLQLARMINGFDTDNTIIHQDEDQRFVRDTPDIQLIDTLSRERPSPVLLTADLNMKTKYAVERKALAGSGLSVVFFRKTFHNLSVHMQAQKILAVWPAIVIATTDAQAPTAFEVTAKGRLLTTGPTTEL